MSTPVRPDLATVVAMYYPLIEQARFGSLKALCKRHGIDDDIVAEAQALASLNRSDLVVVDRLALGDPADKVLAVLAMQPGGAVVLFAGLFGEASEDREDVQAFCRELCAAPEFKGKAIAVGEFRGNPKGALQ